jgi:hypothetical protein
MRGAWVCLLFALAGIAGAQQTVTIYRCTDAFGALTVQNDKPCPKGSRQEKRLVETAPPMPAYQPMPQATIVPDPVPAPADVAPPPPDNPDASATPRLPPPPLFQCNTWDNDSYLSDNGEPEPRCVRLDTVGIGGTGGGLGAGAACQMVTDQCQRIADNAACEAWTRYAREAEAAWKFARAENAGAKQAEYERLARILDESTCGG